jgi:hypothetical protein
MKPKVLATLLLASGLLLAGVGPAASDLIITLKDGRVVTVPVDPGQIRSMEFRDAGGQAAPAPSAAPAPAAPPLPTVAEGDLKPLEPMLPPESIPSGAPPIQVGPDRRIKVPSQAAKIAKDGDIVEIDAGTYAGDVAIWRQNNLTIRGVGGLAHIAASGNAAQGKAIWVIAGNNVTVDSVELTDCAVPDRNGAGIRAEGTNLIIRNSRIHNNQMGILTNPNKRSAILIENSEFAYNSVDYQATGSLGHNIYVGEVRSFVLRGSYVHGASIGHNVKSRAANTYVLYNRIMDEDGNASYLVDLANGGAAYVIGNLFHKAKDADNSAMIAYATEGGKNNSSAPLYVVNNTAASDYEWALLLRNQGSAVAYVANNVFVGGQTIVEGPTSLQANVVGPNVKLVDRARYDFHLEPDSPAVDTGVVVATPDGVSLLPSAEYFHPMSMVPRPRHGAAIDAGAFEEGAP